MNLVRIICIVLLTNNLKGPGRLIGPDERTKLKNMTAVLFVFQKNILLHLKIKQECQKRKKKN